jgi:dihydroxy-acid dehydratase
MISYDIPERMLHVELSAKELEERLKSIRPFEPKIKDGFLGKIYARLVDSVDRGAVLAPVKHP